MEVLSTPAGRVKASACALPLSRLAAFTHPTGADLGLPSDLRFGMSMLLIDFAPRSFVAQNGIENGQQLARHRHDRHEFRLAGIDLPLLESAQRRIVTRRNERADEQRRPHARSAAADEALAFPLAGLPRPRGKRGRAPRSACGRACRVPAARRSACARRSIRRLAPRRANLPSRAALRRAQEASRAPHRQCSDRATRAP